MSDNGQTNAFGAPGVQPRWTSSAKEGVVTAYSGMSRVWCTISHGIINEIYYGTVDRPQTRDMQLLLADGESFFAEEKRDFQHQQQPLADGTLGCRIISRSPDGRLRLTKQVLTSPHQSCVVLQCRLDGDESLLERLGVYVLLAPHVDVAGRDNTGWRDSVVGRTILAATREETVMVLGADVPLAETSCGFVGSSDGYTDLHDNKRMTWRFERAEHGNIAMIARLDLSRLREFRVVVAFGHTLHEAKAELMTVLSEPHHQHLQRFVTQWHRRRPTDQRLVAVSGDGGRLCRNSELVMLAHEDKKYAGGFIASMSIPWGAHRGDDDRGGYHLVWVRDAVHAATAFLALGDADTARRVLVYLACSQRHDGGFSQNFWIDGQAYANGIQLDQVAFPCMLAWRLWKAGGLDDFDPYPALLAAARYLVENGPGTQQDRWEHSAGYVPSTLAVTIAAVACVADFAAARGDRDTASFLLDYADYIESHVDYWTVTNNGELVPGIRRHYIRLLPDCHEWVGDLEPDSTTIHLSDLPPGENAFPASRIVSGDFLELVRYGIRRGDDPLVLDSLRVIDSVLKVQTPGGPCWRRYNHDGYGEHADGSPFDGTGIGRAWPLLTGERGHYEIAAGGDPAPYIRAMEYFQSAGGLISEQIWDAPDIPQQSLRFGRPTGSARPLLWAHAEYVTLLRSAADGAVFDRIAPLADRYLAGGGRKDLEVWKFTRKITRACRGSTVRVVGRAAFRLRWTGDEWATQDDLQSRSSGIGLHYVDLPTSRAGKWLRFTFFWTDSGRWEGRDFSIELVGAARPSAAAAGNNAA